MRIPGAKARTTGEAGRSFSAPAAVTAGLGRSITAGERRGCVLLRSRSPRRLVAATRVDRVGGGVPASRLDPRVRALPALRQRPVSCGRGNPTGRSPARSAGATVTIEVAPSLAQRSDGAVVRVPARPERGQRHLPTRRSPFQPRLTGAARPSTRTAERPCLRPLHAIRLTSQSAALQSP